LKFLVVGLGSMGKRRIRNLFTLGFHDVIGFDTRSDRRKESELKYHVKTFSSINIALEESPDALIISTPPDLHLKYAKIAIKNNIHFFTEVNLSSNETSQILKSLSNSKIVGIPSCTMLFHPVVIQLQKLLQKQIIGKVLFVDHHFGHYLPDWHPWEDYRKFYVSKKNTGGAREIIPFELVWMKFLFPKIKSVSSNVRKISNLDVKIDDIYQIIFEMKNNVLCNLTVDVITQPSIKETKIIGEKGTLICDYGLGQIKIGKNEKWKTQKIKMGKIAPGYKGNTGQESLYEDEIKYFIKCIKKKEKYFYSFKDELEILKILDLIESSSKKGKKLVC
jgi:predicted dehydrogenase